MKALLISGLVFCTQFLFAQSRFTIPVEEDARLEKVVEAIDGNFLIIGKLGKEKYDTVFTPLLYRYNPTTGVHTDINPFQNLNSGFPADVLQVGNEIKVLYNMHDSENDTIDFSIVTLDSLFVVKDIQNYTSPSFKGSQVWVDKLTMKIDRIWVVGHFKWFYEPVPQIVHSAYLAELNKGSILTETSDSNSFSYGYVDGAIFKEDTLMILQQPYEYNETVTVSKFNINNLNETSKSQKFSTSGTSTNEAQNGFKNIQHVGGSNYVSASHLNVSKLHTIPGGGTIDTVNLIINFFDDQFESSQRINLTEEYKNRFNGPGASHFIHKSNICVGATINNVPGREFVQSFKPQYVPVDHYPTQPKSKVMAAMVNDNGTVLWKRVFDSSPDFELITEVVALKDGGCLLAGTRYNANNTNLHDPLFIFLDADGNTSVTEMEQGMQMSTYPNPAQTTVRVEWFPKSLSKSHIKVYNAQGITVLHKSMGMQNVAEIDINTLDPGSYFLQVSQKNGERYSTTLVKN